eukprot:401509-Hanusia_phi.AAC.1
MRLLCLCLLSLLSSSSSQRPASIDVLSSAKCANNEYRDSCGICNGDGGSCATMATVKEEVEVTNEGMTGMPHVRSGRGSGTTRRSSTASCEETIRTLPSLTRSRNRRSAPMDVCEETSG